MTFAAFVKQYQSIPPEKLEGYSASDFEGMSPDERAQARTMLLERALAGDTTDLHGLRHVADDSVITALVAAESRVAALGVRFDVNRRETLSLLTDDPGHLKGLFGWIDGDDADARGFAAEALARHPLPATFIAPIVARLTDGRHEDVARALIGAWLATRGQSTGDIMTFQRHLPFIRSVLAAKPAARSKLL